MRKLKSLRHGIFLLVLLSKTDLLPSTTTLPEFAFGDHTLSVVTADGKPLAGALVYGWCRDYNLIWPRPDQPGGDPAQGRGIPWVEEALGKTGANGVVKVTIPPGRWGFVATASADDGSIIAAWSDFRIRPANEPIVLKPEFTRRWTLCASDGLALSPARLFIRPEGFPIWVPVTPSPSRQNAALQINAGKMQLFAEGESSQEPSTKFAMSWGVISSATPDGKLTPPGQPATVACNVTSAPATLEWRASNNAGLYGEISLKKSGNFLLSPGLFAISYDRPITSEVTAGFAPQVFNLAAGQGFALNFGGPLTSQLDQDRDKSTPDKLFARLYLVDSNGFAVSDLVDSKDREIKIGASLEVNGQRFQAGQVFIKNRKHGTMEEGATLFSAKYNGSIASGVTWEFSAPPGVLPQTKLSAAPRASFKSHTFDTEAPAILARQAQNVLAQADLVGEAMDNVTGRKRKLPSTSMWIEPGHTGASASHNGERIKFATSFFLVDEPVHRHTFNHELAHNFGLTHGGMMETVVEATRSFGGEQFIGQPAKWLFMDRMNGKQYPEKPYANTGLYLYCYAVGGQPFLRFLLANETNVKEKLGKKGHLFTDDEITAALLSLALNRDTTSICSTYGLNVTPQRVQSAVTAARNLCIKP